MIGALPFPAASERESDPDVAFLEGADAVDSGQWDHLARRGFQLHGWFAAAERWGWRARHVAVGRSRGPSSIVPAYLTGAGTLNDLHDRWLGPLRAITALARLSLRPVLSVQAPFALISEPLGGELSPELLHRVFEALEVRAVADGAKAVAWPCVDADCNRLIQVASDRGYAVLYAGASARLAVQWNSFEDYVASRSKSVRRTIKADLHAMSTARLRVTNESEFQSAVPAMDALYQDAFRRRNGRKAAVPRGFLEELSLHPSPNIRAQLTWSGNQLVGTSLNLGTPRLLEGTFAAFASEHHGGSAYYNDLCYEPIRYACRQGIAGIDLGATALYAKVLRGALLRRRMILIRGTTLRRHRLLRALGSLVARRTEWKERRTLGPLWRPHIFSEE